MKRLITAVWNDPVGSKVIAAGIIFVIGIVGTLFANRLDWFQEAVGISRALAIAILFVLFPANIWWLWRLTIAIVRKFTGQNDGSTMLFDFNDQSGVEKCVSSLDSVGTIEFTPNETQNKILAYVFKCGDPGGIPSNIRRILELNYDEELQFHLTELVHNNYLKEPFDDESFTYYGITQRGRRHVIESKLLEDTNVGDSN